MFAFRWQVDVASRESLDAYSRHSWEIINEKSSYGMWLKTERCFVSSKQTKINVETLSIMIFCVFSLDVVVSLSLDGVVSCDVHTNCVVVSDVMSHSLALFRVLKLKGDVLCRCSSLCLLYSFFIHSNRAHNDFGISLSLAKQQLRHELHSSASDCDVW